MRKFIRFIVRKIPRVWLIRFSSLFSYIILPFYIGNKVECPVCNHHFRKFLPYGNKGMDNRLCPNCLSLERHRLLWLWLHEKTGFFKDELKVLHVAPEQPFIKKFRTLKNLDYTTADIESPLADVKMDIRQIPFDDALFDVFICNHVLEHIDDEPKALAEIYRVLKPGGWAILQVPVNPAFGRTYEDASITTPAEREKHFGQYDHVRWHGLDYPQRLRDTGFHVTEDAFVKEIPASLRQRYRLAENEIIYVSNKP